MKVDAEGRSYLELDDVRRLFQLYPEAFRLDESDN